MMEPYSRIGPVLLNRYVFNSGTFRIQKAWFGYQVVRTEVYLNEIYWENDLPSDKWVANGVYSTITYTLSKHLTMAKASETLHALKRTYSNEDNIFPKYVGEIDGLGIDYRLSGIRKLVQQYRDS